MTIFQTLFAMLLLVTFSTVTMATDDSKEISDPALTKALVDGFTKLADVYEKADPKDIAAYQNIVSEAAAFILYLSRCEKAIPISEHGTSSLSTVPPSFDLKLKYPLTIKAEITPKPETDTLMILLVSKEAATSSWKLFDGWMQTKSEEKKEKVTIPSEAIQKKANDVLPRILKSDDCKCE